jgi:DNA-directed RNA polymerase specialized sigma24 family protein
MRKQVPMRELRGAADLDSLRKMFSSIGTADSQAELEWKEMKTTIRALVEGLGEDRRSVLLLYSAGMSIEEIGELCRWDKVKVRHLLYRGIGDLREKMNLPAGEESPAG